MSRRRPLSSGAATGAAKDGRSRRRAKTTRPAKAAGSPKAPQPSRLTKTPRKLEGSAPKSTKRARSRPRAKSDKGSKRAPTGVVAGPRPQRHLSRFTKVALVGGFMTTALALGGQWLLHQSYFRVQHVTFTGLHHETPAEVLVASGLERHPTMLGISVAVVRHNLDRFAWIEGVSIVKRWPNTLEVHIQESKPVAVAFNAQHALQYVNAEGRDLGPAPLHVNLPTLLYLQPIKTTWPFQRAGYDAAYVASVLPRAFASQVSVVTVDAHGSVSLRMTTPLSFVLGPPTNLTAKFIAIASVIAHSTLGPGSVVDVTVPGELAVSGPPPG